MTVKEVFEQAKALSPEERRELLKMLVDTFTTEQQPEQTRKTGAEIVAMIEALEAPIEMKYPEIEDPVAWVRHLRAEERRRRLGDWGDEEG